MLARLVLPTLLTLLLALVVPFPDQSPLPEADGHVRPSSSTIDPEPSSSRASSCLAAEPLHGNPGVERLFRLTSSLVHAIGSDLEEAEEVLLAMSRVDHDPGSLSPLPATGALALTPDDPGVSERLLATDCSGTTTSRIQMAQTTPDQLSIHGRDGDRPAPRVPGAAKGDVPDQASGPPPDVTQPPLATQAPAAISPNPPGGSQEATFRTDVVVPDHGLHPAP